jgi:hypothetical protein
MTGYSADPASFPYPVWGTDHGGLVRKMNGRFVFLEAPNHSGLAFGDPLPSGWTIHPANEAAKQADEVNKSGS